MIFAADDRRGVIRHTNEHDLAQGAIPQLRMWDVRLGKGDNATAVNAVTHPVDGEGGLLPHLTLAQKEVLDKDLLLSNAHNDIVHDECRAAPIRVLLTIENNIITE